MNFDHLFIVTYGRSGSTLVQGVLNSIPGVMIRGENNAALRPLLNAWSKIAAVKNNSKLIELSAAPKNSWFGLSEIDTDDFGRRLADTFIQSVLRPCPETKTVGFKEIRYYPSMCPDLDAELAFMRRFFPRAGFIVNTRDIEATIYSARRQNISPEEIRASDTRLRELAHRGDADVFHLHYDKFTRDPDSLQSLYSWLGAEWDRESVLSVLETPHSVIHKGWPGNSGPQL